MVLKGFTGSGGLLNTIRTHLDTAGVGLTSPHVRNSTFHEFDGKLKFQCLRNGSQNLVSLLINLLLWATHPNLVVNHYLLCIHLLWSKETENPQNQGCSLILFFWVFVLVWESFRGSWATPEYPPWPLSRGLPFRARPSPLRIPLMCFLFFVFIGARKPVLPRGHAE